MGLWMSVLVAAISAASVAAPESGNFPGSYFDSVGKTMLQQRAMDRWPGPTQLVHGWRAGAFDDDAKIGLLLGASASHDPVLIPLYRESVTSANPRLRMAAAYGYRDLLGDALPNLAGGVDPVAATALAGEMDAVAATLQTRPLVEMWLQSALATEGKSMPGWKGTMLHRPAGICFRAVEQVLDFDDVRYVMIAYRTAENRGNRATLLRLLEAMTLKRFFDTPDGQSQGWGVEDLDEALAAGDSYVSYWLDVRCVDGVDSMLRASFAEMNARVAQPRLDSSFDIWLRLLRWGPPTWRAMVARQLYAFGGQWPQLSILQAESKTDQASWQRLLGWYGVLDSRGAGRARVPR